MKRTFAWEELSTSVAAVSCPVLRKRYFSHDHFLAISRTRLLCRQSTVHTYMSTRAEIRQKGSCKGGGERGQRGRAAETTAFCRHRERP